MKKIKLPSKLKIMAHTWKIRFPYVFKEDNNIDGLRDHDAKEILISGLGLSGAHRTPDTIWIILFHELFHVVDDMLGQKVFTSDYPDEKELKEGLCDAFSELWYHILNDNGLLKKPK
jgi:hypothetical protein